MAENVMNGQVGEALGQALVRVGILGCAEIAKKNINAIQRVEKACVGA